MQLKSVGYVLLMWSCAEVSFAANIASVAKVAPGDTAAVGTGKQWPTTRFVLDPSGQCLSDNLTGLMWPKNGIIGFVATNGGALLVQPNYANTTPNLNHLTWVSAKAAIVNLNAAATKLCGYSDWRLPNIVELSSLVNYAQSNPATWLNLAAQGFSNVRSDNGSASSYWSSSTAASFPNSALVVSFNYGNVGADGKTGSDYVWPVRGGQ